MDQFLGFRPNSTALAVTPGGRMPSSQNAFTCSVWNVSKRGTTQDNESAQNATLHLEITISERFTCDVTEFTGFSLQKHSDKIFAWVTQPVVTFVIENASKESY